MTSIYDRAARIYSDDMRNAYPEIAASQKMANIDAGGVQAQLKYLDQEISKLTEVLDILTNKLTMVLNPAAQEDTRSLAEPSARSELAGHLQNIKNRVASNVQRIVEINQSLDL